ncbi:aminopeptidase P family protein [Pontiella sp.]|uniref:aminopeptidase P family protein n=1 Tax=Pontiella sp. TaxID=2837462 RepID=UPI003564EAE1
MKENTAKENVRQLRASMEHYKLDAYIVPSADPHQTEYAHPHWRSRAWVSGFSGSAGTAVVLKEKAGLWTDGRYFIQAEIELKGSGIDLFKERMDGVPELIDWVRDNVPEGGAVGIDGRLLTAQQADQWEAKLKKRNIRLVIDLDLVSGLWKDRPALPTDPVRLYPVEYAGRSAADKLQEIRAALVDKEADSTFIAPLYDIAWLFNIRGNDTPRCPLVTAYALVQKESATLFVDEAKIDEATRMGLAENGIAVVAYNTAAKALAALPEKSTLYLCEERVSASLRRKVKCKVVTGSDLTDLPKARKNETELGNWATVQELDGAAMVRYWKWLEEEAVAKGTDEFAAQEYLGQLRLSQPDCLDLSFNSISAYGPNAAMMHYSAKPDGCATLEPKGFYLIDSGGQYLGGTTDITRTFALGELTEEQRLDYTLVLQGVIGLSSARFLKGAAGTNLDILARQPQWERGLDYKCGTGHGVGCYLNVHEGPQGFSQFKRHEAPLEPGMVVTIEPGVYKEGLHGIRIENMVVVKADRETECGVFYRFDTMTLFPIDTAPLLTEIMSQKEIDWLNAYHQTVCEKLAPHLSDEEVAWLETKTAPIG